jgi:hypothetical protein
VLHAATAALVALAVAALAGPGWAAVAGLATAAYRPFLVYAGVHEPETAILFCLAVAVACGAWARRLGQAGPPPRSWTGAALAAASGLALAAAGLLRPHHLILLPVWAYWLTPTQPAQPASSLPGKDGTSDRRTRRSARIGLSSSAAVLLAALALLAPFVVSRWRATGSLAVMNPGPVFYEGNAPGATGLRRHAPPAVLALERAHPAVSDYGHVAYRRIASWAAGRRLSPGAANRYWTRLAWQGIAAWPARSAGRFIRKALFSVMPYEAHDLIVAEHLDRRLRRVLPWGFAFLVVAAPWPALAPRRRLADLAGPLAVAGLALTVQIAFYASARQRLPLALAMLVAGPVLLADLARGRLDARVRRPLALALGVVIAAALAVASGRWALLDQLEWDDLLGRRPVSPAERLLAFQDGRAGRTELREDALLFRAALARHRAGDLAASLPAFAALSGRGRDFTIDEDPVGVPEYWLARAFLAGGEPAHFRAALAAALATRPDEPRLLALVSPAGPPGVDPVSARLALADAARAADRPSAAQAVLRPLAPAFPELGVERRLP